MSKLESKMKDLEKKKKELLEKQEKGINVLEEFKKLNAEYIKTQDKVALERREKILIKRQEAMKELDNIRQEILKINLDIRNKKEEGTKKIGKARENLENAKKRYKKAVMELNEEIGEAKKRKLELEIKKGKYSSIYKSVLDDLAEIKNGR